MPVRGNAKGILSALWSGVWHVAVSQAAWTWWRWRVSSPSPRSVLSSAAPLSSWRSPTKSSLWSTTMWTWTAAEGTSSRWADNQSVSKKLSPSKYFTFKSTSLTSAAEFHLTLSSGYIILCAKWSNLCCWNAPLFFFCINSVGVVFYATKLGSINSQGYKPTHKAPLTSENRI